VKGEYSLPPPRAAVKLLDHINQADDARVMCVGRPSQLDIGHRQPSHGDGDDMPSKPADGAITDDCDQLPWGRLRVTTSVGFTAAASTRTRT
jgi:hypothetical protein